jgi:hypothetical protein
MKTAHEWHAVNEPVVHYYETEQEALAAERLMFGPIWKTHAQVESERQHWLDMAHPLPKRKGKQPVKIKEVEV